MANISKINEVKQLEKKRILFFLVQVLALLSITFVEFCYSDLINNSSFRLIHALIFLFSTLLIISIVRIAVVFLYVKKKRRHITYKDNFILGIKQIASILSVITLVISVLILFKINYKELFTSISIFAVALTLIFKDYISNTINGMILMFSNQISLNEYVKIGHNYGKIVDITLKNVILRNDNEEYVYIPNNIIFSSEITNYSKSRNEKGVVEFEMSADNFEKPEHMEEYLVANLSSGYGPYLKTDSLALKVVRISKDTISFKFEFVLNRKNTVLEKEIKNFLNQKILTGFFKNEGNLRYS